METNKVGLQVWVVLISNLTIHTYKFRLRVCSYTSLGMRLFNVHGCVRVPVCLPEYLLVGLNACMPSNNTCRYNASHLKPEGFCKAIKTNEESSITTVATKTKALLPHSLRFRPLHVYGCLVFGSDHFVCRGKRTWCLSSAAVVWCS